MNRWFTDTIKPYMQQTSNGEGSEFLERDFLDAVYHNFHGIMETYDALEFSAVLLSENGPNSKKVSEDSYYRYIINAYLQDMYTLNERLNAYATRIKRAHYSLGRSQQVDLFIEPVFDVIKQSFKGIVDTRGGHVQQKHYTEQTLNEANLLPLTAQTDPSYLLASNMSRETLKNEWVGRVNKNNIKVKELLNYYFGCLYCVIQENQKVFVP